MKPSFVLTGIMLLASASIQAETYRWVDAAGKVHYGDMPPVEAVQIEQKRFGKESGINNADLPYETRRALKNFPVTLYMTSKCGAPCQKAQDFLNKRGIPFDEKTLLTQKDIDEFRQQSGSNAAPTLQVGNTYLEGLDAERWNNELDIAGYPKTAPYRPQGATPQAATPPADNPPVNAPMPEDASPPEDTEGH